MPLNQVDYCLQQLGPASCSSGRLLATGRHALAYHAVHAAAWLVRPCSQVPAWAPAPRAGAKLGAGGKRWGDKGFYVEPTGGGQVRPAELPAHGRQQGFRGCRRAGVAALYLELPPAM